MKLFFFLALLFCSRAFAIANGQDAQPRVFPWLVSVYSKKSVCSGALISSRHVLTAAHCFSNTDMKADSFTVASSPSGLWKDKVKLPEIKKLHLNGFLDWGEGHGEKLNDIAILELKEAVVFSETLSPAKLPVHPAEIETVLLDSEAITIAGWGYDESDSYPEHAKYLKDLPLLPSPNDPFWQNPENEGLLKRSNYDLQAYLSHQYIGFKTLNVRTSCNGDSGGPMTKDDLLIEISSHGANATVGCLSRNMSFYTSTGPFLDWIRSIIDI